MLLLMTNKVKYIQYGSNMLHIFRLKEQSFFNSKTQSTGKKGLLKNMLVVMMHGHQTISNACRPVQIEFMFSCHESPEIHLENMYFQWPRTV